MNIYKKIDCVITAPHCIAKRLPFVHIATDCIPNQQDSSMTWFPQIVHFFDKSYTQQARYWKPPIATHPTSALTMCRANWVISIPENDQKPQTPAIVWPPEGRNLSNTAKNRQISENSPDQCIHHVWIELRDSIQNNDRTLPIVIIASFKWAEYWSKNKNLVSYHKLYFSVNLMKFQWKFLETDKKTWIVYRAGQHS